MAHVKNDLLEKWLLQKLFYGAKTLEPAVATSCQLSFQAVSCRFKLSAAVARFPGLFLGFDDFLRLSSKTKTSYFFALPSLRVWKAEICGICFVCPSFSRILDL
jgi:hypothetical protein